MSDCKRARQRSSVGTWLKGAAVYAALTSTVGTAHADPRDVGPSSEPAHLEATPGRLRGGYDFGVTAGRILGDTSCNGVTPCVMFAPFIAGDFGYQISRYFGVMFRGEAGLALVSNYAAAFMVFEATPARGFSIGVGAGLDANVEFLGVAYYGYGGFGFPVLARINFLDRSEWARSGGKNSWRLGLEAVPGVEATEGRFMMRGGLSVGYAYM